MRCYSFLVDGIRVLVYSPLGERLDVSSVLAGMADGEMTVVIRPDLVADFFVECFDKRGDSPRDGDLALAVLSHFFRVVRGLPSVSLEMMYRGNLHELYIGDGDDKFSVNVGKCKLLCTKTAIFADGVEILVDAVRLGYECACTSCADSDLFATERLSALREAVVMPVGTPAIAVSFDGTMKVRTCGSIPYYDAIAVGAFSLLERGTDIPGGRLTAHVNGRRYTFSLSDGVLTFYPDIKYLY